MTDIKLPEPVAFIDPRQLAQLDRMVSMHCITKPVYRSWADAQAGVQYVPVHTVDQLLAAIDAARTEGWDAAIAAERAERAKANALLSHAGLLKAQEEHNALRAAAEQARAALSDLLATGDPVVYSAALRALDDALGTTG